MEYELHLYACIQPANDVEIPRIHTDKDINWSGVAAWVSQEEYDKYFPEGKITAEGFAQFIMDSIKAED